MITPHARLYRAIGMMSGTSMDGIDCALVETDGEQIVNILPPKLLYPYSDAERDLLRSVQGGKGDVAHAEHELTHIHTRAIKAFLTDFNLKHEDIDLIGFHGQTIFHNPGQRVTWQIGNGLQLAQETGIKVISQFRVMDVAAGGQGAPLVPLYHLARAGGLPRPLAILNIGGVSNVTYIGADDSLIAFDTGPGNALIDDWLLQHTGQRLDEGGRLASTGRVFQNVIDEVLARPFFAKCPPKSLDRHDFHTTDLSNLSVADGAATLTSLTVQTIAAANTHFPQPPVAWYITGGGRHNATMMAMLAAALDAPVQPVEALGWDGDFLEADAFGYLAVRAYRQLPLTLPSTTGVKFPLSGGVLHRP